MRKPCQISNLLRTFMKETSCYITFSYGLKSWLGKSAHVLKYHAMRTYGRTGIKLHAFLISALEAGWAQETRISVLGFADSQCADWAIAVGHTHRTEPDPRQLRVATQLYGFLISCSDLHCLLTVQYCVRGLDRTVCVFFFLKSCALCCCFSRRKKDVYDWLLRILEYAQHNNHLNYHLTL
jgi:hypothetical protein